MKIFSSTFMSLLFLTTTNQAARFTFKATSRLSTADNWLHEEVPCHGDHIRFDNTLPVVAFMDHNVDAESITLPENGMLLFSDNGVELSGGDANWQCEKNENWKDAFFTRDTHLDTSFFSPNSWIRDEVGEELLHMNLVPSEYDDVAVSSLSAAQIYLDLPVVVNSFQWYKRNKMSTEDFNVLLRSMEGQFQIQLARPWARESDLGGVQRMVANDPITVRNRKLEDVRGGRVNPNSSNKTLSTICEYIHCKEEHSCIDTFIPFGHCCPVCGGRIELAALDLDMEMAREKIQKIIEELDGKDGQGKTVDMSFERKTVNLLSSKYEVVIALKPDHHFNEDFYEIATRRIVNDLAISMKNYAHRSILDFKIHLSKVDRTIRTLSRVVACLIYFIVIIGIVAVYVNRNVDVQVSRQNLLKPVVKYRRQNDDVAIELDDVGMSEEHLNEDKVEEEKSEKENDDNDGELGAINPNFDFSETSEDIEMSDIHVPRGNDPSDVENLIDVDVNMINPNFQPDFETENHESSDEEHKEPKEHEELETSRTPEEPGEPEESEETTLIDL